MQDAGPTEDALTTIVASKDLSKLDPSGYPAHIQALFKAVLVAFKDNKVKELNLNAHLKYELRNEEKLVCAKVIKYTDTVVECQQCRMDSTCIICIDCFNNGNHEGHKYKIRTGSSGCCDCGDREAWKPSGFCTKHTGQAAPPQISEAQMKKFSSDWGYLFFWYFVSGRKEFGALLAGFLKVLTMSMHYTVLLENFLATSFDKMKHPGLMPALYDNCILDLLFLRRQAPTNKLLEELFIQMFQSYSFKQSLITTFFRTYPIAVLASGTKTNLSGLAFQLITSYELVSWVVATLRKPLIFDGDAVSIDFENENSFNVHMQHIVDLKSLCKLQNGADLDYVRLHLSDISNLDCLVSYWKDVDMHWDNSPQDSLLTDSFYIEVQMLGVAFHLIRVASTDRELLQRSILSLIDKCESIKMENVCYFPLHRILSLMLFAYFHGEQSQDFTNVLVKRLRDSKIFNPFFRMMHFLVSSRMNIKLRELHFRFFAFYVDSYRDAFGIDTYMIKLFVRFGFLNNLNVLDFFILNCSQEQNMAYRQLLSGGDVLANHSDILTVVRTVASLLSLLTELCVSPCEEIALYSKIFRNNGQYSSAIKSLLRQYVGSVSNCTVQLMNHFKNSYLNMFVDEEIKEVCTFDKQKKTYQLKQKLEEGDNFPQEYFMSKAAANESSDQKKYEFSGKGLRPDRALVVGIYSKEMFEKLGRLIRNLTIISDGDTPDHKEMHFAINGLVFEMLKISNVLKQSQQNELLSMVEEALTSCNKVPTLLDNKNRQIMDELFHNVTIQAPDNPNDDSRKDRIREIQRRKLEEMRNKQKKFVTKNEQSLAKEVEEMAAPDSDFCVFCHNPIDGNFFVYCASFSMSNFYADSQLKALAGKLAEEGCSEQDRKVWTNLREHYSAELRTGRPVLTSCLHPMHYPCFLSFSHNKSEIMCPLCKRKTDLIVPVLRQMEKLNVDDTKNKLSSVIIFFGYVARLTHEHSGRIETEDTSDIKFQGLVEIVRSVVEVLCYSGTFDQSHFEKTTLRLYQEMLGSLSIYQKLLSLKKETGKQMRKCIEDNSDLLLLSGVSSDAMKNYIRGSYESLIVLSLTDFLEGGREEMIVKRIHEYMGHSTQYRHLFQTRGVFLARLLGLTLPKPKSPKMEVEGATEEHEKYVLVNQPLTLVKLPSKYRQLATLRGKCPNCEKAGHSIYLCLACNWRGCQKCTVCSLQVHSLQRHCGNTLFIHTQTTQVLMTCFKECWKEAALYTDELGKPFNVFSEWDDYSLSQEDYQRLQQLLFRYLIPVTIRYNRLKQGFSYNFDQF